MIIGICGLIGAGKDTIADHLVDDHSFVFAHAHSDACTSLGFCPMS